MLKGILRKIGIDGAIGYSVSARIIQAGGGLLSVALISIFLSKEEQGYYYTFGSLVAIQVFFELGLGLVITQYVAHEVSHLKWVTEDRLEGDEIHLSRISSLLRFCIKVFGVIALLFFVALNVSGHIFFSRYHAGNVNWQFPWQLLAFSTSVILFIDPILSFTEGLGKVKEVAKVRFIQQILNTVTVSIVFICKGGILAPGIAAFVSLFVLLSSIVFTNRKKLLLFIYKQQGAAKVNYLKEIFPFQYKIALSWVSGYFIFQLFNPVLFATEGPVVAGQMGMTLVALNGISSLTMSWITTKIPLFCSFVAQQAYDQLNSVFSKTLLQLLTVNIVLISSFFIFVQTLVYLKVPLAHRFLTTTPLLMLCLVTLVNQLIFSWAAYLRSHKQEPYLINSIVGGILCALSTFFLGKSFGLMGIVGGYTFLSVCIGFPWAYYVFKIKKKQWHSIA